MNELSEIARTMGKAGGLATSKKLGKEHYIKLAENMNRKRAERKEREAQVNISV